VLKHATISGSNSFFIAVSFNHPVRHKVAEIMPHAVLPGVACPELLCGRARFSRRVGQRECESEGGIELEIQPYQGDGFSFKRSDEEMVLPRDER